MSQMTRCASISPLGSEFDNFLFAPIGEDDDGMLLSVLSALTRLDVDPWKAAAELNQLPRETATRKLAAAISTIPNWRFVYPDTWTVADRLVALLPKSAGSKIPSSKALRSVGDVIDVQRWWIPVVFISFLLGCQLVMISRQFPAKVDRPEVTTSSVPEPQKPIENSGQ